MRVVLMVHEFPTTSETFVVRKFLGLLGAGVDVFLVADRINDAGWASFPALAGNADARARVWGWPRPSDLRRSALAVARAVTRSLIRDPRGLARSLSVECGRHGVGGLGRAVFALPVVWRRPDIVHHEFGTGAVYRGDLKAAAGGAMTCSFRGFDLNYAGIEDEGFYDDAWRELDGVHVLGGSLRRRALDRGMPQRMFVAEIPPGVDPERFRPAPRAAERIGTPPRPLRLLSVGRLHWKKGYEFALRAVRELRDRGVHLEHRVVGDGPFAEAVRSCVADLGLEPCVRLVGAVDQDAVRDELGRCDVFLHAAVSEGFCNAVLEAQAMAVPVVCSDADGLADNVDDGTTGFVVPRRDASALAAAVRRLVDDAELRITMGDAGRARVAKHFHPDLEIERFVAFYRAVLERRGERGGAAP